MQTDFPGSIDSGLRLIQAQYWPYRVAFRNAWQSAQGSHRIRRGFLLRLESGQGISGYGECAPLPQAGTETLVEAEAALKAMLPGCRGASITEVAARLDDFLGTPAARCALETALLDICAREKALPLFRWLRPDAVGHVAVNAACGCLDEDFGARLQRALAQGYRIIKIKLGCYPLEEEIHHLRQLQLPDGISLRLDANRAWSIDQAMRAIEVCGRLPVDSLEEPVHKPDLTTLHLLQQQATFPLALDESLTDVFAATPADELPVKRLVLKPTAMGGVLAVLGRARCAQRAGIESVVTSTLETSVGLWAAVHAAAALDSHLAHGLATAEWFENPDPALCPVQGMLDIDSQAASGLPSPAIPSPSGRRPG